MSKTFYITGAMTQDPHAYPLMFSYPRWWPMWLGRVFTTRHNAHAGGWERRLWVWLGAKYCPFTPTSSQREKMNKYWAPYR